MPKKQPKNAFYFFMVDYRRRCERNGEKFHDGWKDVQGPAGDEWKVLTAEMKRPYEQQAKAAKLHAKEDTSRKVTSLHNSYKYLDEKKEEEERRRREMETWIERTLSSLLDLNSMARKKFYVVHANYLIVTETDNYYTVEVAIAEFCLEGGVTNTYHTLIDPGFLPLGTLNDARIKSEQYHKIPVDCNIGEKDKYKIFSSIKNFLQPGKNAKGDWPALFTMEDNVAANTSISCVIDLMRVLSESADEDPDQFKVYPLDRLFFQLKNAASQLADGSEAFPSLGFAKNELDRDIHNYDFNIACDYHQKIDVVQWCSLSYVQRWVFLICDHCCEYVNVRLVPGKHCPLDTDIQFLPTQIKNAQAQKKAQPAQPGTFSWVDHSKQQASNWNPVDQPPLPRPTRQYQPVQLSHRMNNLEISEDNFPSITIGRGRGKQTPSSSSGSAGGPPINYAAAMKK